MRFHYDINGGEVVLRDIRVYDSGTIPKGAAVAIGPVATPANQGGAIIANEQVLSNIIGVTNEEIVAASITAQGVDIYAKCIINPGAVYLAEYAKDEAALDEALTGADATGKTLTYANGVADHEGYWAYITDIGGVGGGFGNLFKVGATTGTTVLTATTDFDDNLLANIIGDTFILIKAPYTADVAGGSCNLAGTSDKLSGYPGAQTGAAIILENYIESSRRPMEVLRAARHSGINYKGETPRFYGDVIFSENLHYAGGAVCNRVIT